MCCSIFYRSLPYLYALIGILEVCTNILLARAVIKTWPSDDKNSTMITATTTIPITLQATRRTTFETTTTMDISTTTWEPFAFDEIPLAHLIAFGTAFIGSIVPIFTGLVLLFSLFGCCLCFAIESCRRPYLRFISLNCNCPCYVPRPKLRFRIRIGFHFFCIILRIIATMMYGILYMEATTDAESRVIYLFLLITGSSLIFPFISILLDLYHYRVWWSYEPDVEAPADVLAKSYSHKHKRFIPYVLTEPYRTQTFGNRKCKYGEGCKNRELEHVVIFHSSSYQPQPRWTKAQKVYIGFHQTTPLAALNIARSDFRVGDRGMLGPGAYFARSRDGCKPKVREQHLAGAWFIAEIEMGQVYPVDGEVIRKDFDSPRYDRQKDMDMREGKWAAEHDTCYYRHPEESRDEFCIKDPKRQIRRWVIVIEGQHDRKLMTYGLGTELSSNMCGCI